MRTIMTVERLDILFRYLYVIIVYKIVSDSVRRAGYFKTKGLIRPDTQLLVV